MPFGFRKTFGFRRTFRLGRFLKLNLSQRGACLSGRVHRASTNSRTRELQVRLPFGSAGHRNGVGPAGAAESDGTFKRAPGHASRGSRLSPPRQESPFASAEPDAMLQPPRAQRSNA